MFGRIEVANIAGDLRQSVAFEFGVVPILAGSGRFYIRNDWLILELRAFVCGRNYGTVNIPLI
jgi:hypothetical protein